jgi:hypothetical protein
MLNRYAACEKKHGKPIDLAVRSTYNPKTQKYFALHHQTRRGQVRQDDCADDRGRGGSGYEEGGRGRQGLQASPIGESSRATISRREFLFVSKKFGHSTNRRYCLRQIKSRLSGDF